MKKRSFNQIETSESDEDSGPGSRAQELKMTPRSSARLKTRANRQFRLPSRDEVLSRIVPEGSKETPGKSLAELRPRKLVNNFLKVNNRYNYDPDFTDSDTSLGGFLDDEEENEKEEEGNSTSDGEDEDSSRSQTSQSSSSEEEECLKRSKRPRGRQKLHVRELRRKKLSARETDSDDEGKVCTTTKKRRRRQSSVLDDDSSSNEDQKEEGKKKSRRAESLRRKKRKQKFFEEYRAKRALRKAKV